MNRPTAQQVLDVARGQIGYAEKPVNRSKFGAWFGMDGQRWCAMFTSWCFNQAGMPRSGMTHTAWTPGIYTTADRANRWHPSGAKPGDLVLFSFSRPSATRPLGISHVGLVEEVRADGVATIEGNTDGGGSNNGGQVMRKIRRSRIAGFARPVYAVGPSLELGSRVLRLATPHLSGADVLAWQRDFLVFWRARVGGGPAEPIRPAGNFLTRTRDETVRFQEFLRIPATGVVDSRTLVAARAWRATPDMPTRDLAAQPAPRFKIAAVYRDDAPVDEGIALTTGIDLNIAVLPLSRAAEAERAYLIGAAAVGGVPPGVVETKAVAGANRKQTAQAAAALRRRYRDAGSPQLRELI